MNILITGASRGIGAETARLLAPNNTLILHYNRSKAEVQAVAAEVEKLGGEAMYIRADLSTEDGCYKLASFVKYNFVTLQALINNAGGAIKRLLVEDISWEYIEKVFHLNTFSVMMLTKLLAPLLKASEKADIINVTSVAIRYGAPTATVYAAAKSAIDAFTRGVAKELAPKIKVNAVAPGFIDTTFHDNGITSQARIDQAIAATPLQMAGQSIHVAQTIKFILDNDFMTGETVDVNGGLWMR